MRLSNDTLLDKYGMASNPQGNEQLARDYGFRALPLPHLSDLLLLGRQGQSSMLILAHSP
jgi:hypothetical protein